RNTPGWLTIRSPSKKLRTVQTIQRNAGATKGRRRRAHRATSATPSTTASNHSCTPSGRSGSVRTTVPMALATAVATIRTSSPQAARNRRTGASNAAYDGRAVGVVLPKEDRWGAPGRTGAASTRGDAPPRKNAPGQRLPSVFRVLGSPDAFEDVVYDGVLG